MNPVVRRIALWFSESFVASALEVIFETFVEVWNYSVLKYELPLPCIKIDEINDETKNRNHSINTIDGFLQITDNLIDFSQDEAAVRSLPHIGEPKSDNVSKCYEILTPLKGLPYTLNNELEAIHESSFELLNTNDSNDIVTTQDGAEQIERKISTDVNVGTFEENNLKEGLNYDSEDSFKYLRHHESSEVLKECEEAETTNIFGIIAEEAVQHGRGIDGIIKNGNSGKSFEIPLNAEHSRNNSSSTHTIFENSTELHQEIISNKPEDIVVYKPDFLPIDGSEISLEDMNASVLNKNTEKRIMASEVCGMKSFSNKQRRLQFSEEIEIFIFEPERNVHHPCVILKYPINIIENKDEGKIYQSTLIIEEIEETSFQSCIIRNQEKEIVFKENRDILETMRKVYDGRRAINGYLSDESDTSDVSLERQSRLEDGLQLTTEDNRVLLENMYPICDCSKQQTIREGDSKDSRTGNGKRQSYKAAVKAARKQSKNILDKIYKKLFQQKFC